MSRKKRAGDDAARREPEDVTPPDPAFVLERKHERRILSWSPDPELEERGPAQVADAPEPSVLQQPRSPQKPVQPSRPTRDPDVRRPPAAAAPPAARGGARVGADANGGEPADEEQRPRRRGRPKGKAERRQVHFHVNPEEDRLLLTAAARYGSQQKGLIAALRSLQEAELLRDEIERLRLECERQQQLLEEAEALFKR